MSSPPVSYLSLIYDIVLVRDRLRWIISELESGEVVPFPELTVAQLLRVNDFLGKKLEERGIHDGIPPEDFPRLSTLPGEEAPMEP